ncbi:MAG: glycosyltransferase family 9 protein [Rhodospirillaceae bacterium]|jgi:heptosyltransferase III|nr:glycosyltransferase family 9 protein [Rhodospirillaceae bacterium]MBT6118545.1 glycosyltransferase family 9 protein [Rhodospirillaceae bacterium]
MRILFITASRIGDAVLSSGLLGHMVDRYPDAKITVACGPAAAPLFEAVPNLEWVIALEKRSLGRHWLHLWRDCFPYRWRAVVDLRNSAVPYFLFARERYSKGSSVEGLHVVEQMGRVLGLEEPPAPRLWTAPEHWQAAELWLPPGGPVLAVAPVANWRGKQWRAARFVELIRRLTGPEGILPGAQVAVFGSAEDRVQAQAVIASIPPGLRVDLVGGPDLLTALACLRRCSFFVGNDSGTMHLAAAAGIPTLGLFGPSKDELYRPWGPRAAVARTALTYDQLVGGPGYDHKTTGTLMDSLSVEAAEIAARELWRRCRDEAA